MRKLQPLLLCLLAMIAIAPGCGGESGVGGAGSADAGEIGTSSLTERQFVKRVSAICKAGREDVPKRVAEFQVQNPPRGESPAEHRAKGVQATILPVLEEELERIHRLGAPAGDEERLEAILVAQREAIDEVAGLDQLDPAEGVMESYFADSSRALREYGLTECTVK